MSDAIRDIIVPIVSILVTIGIAYFTATYAVRHEQANGKARLLEICNRHVVVFIEAFRSMASAPQTDLLVPKFYVEELKRIVDDLDKLLGNAYVEKLILEHPLVTMAMVQIRKELNQHLTTSGGRSHLIYEPIIAMLNLRDFVRRDLGRRAPNTDFDRDIDQAEKIIREAYEGERQAGKSKQTASGN